MFNSIEAGYLITLEAPYSLPNVSTPIDELRRNSGIRDGSSALATPEGRPQSYTG